jgi:hypothetical protein
MCDESMTPCYFPRSQGIPPVRTIAAEAILANTVPAGAARFTGDTDAQIA